MSADEYREFVEVVKQYGGEVAMYAEFPTTDQRDKARDELKRRAKDER
jgi:hypothetical protein